MTMYRKYNDFMTYHENNLFNRKFYHRVEGCSFIIKLHDELLTSVKLRPWAIDCSIKLF